MTNPFPLLIIMGTIVALVAIQRALTRIGNPPKGAAAQAPAPPSPKPRGRPLFPGLSATGLDERGIKRMKEQISNRDTDALATFLAIQRPGVMELDEYLSQTRTLFLDSLPDVANKTSPQNIQKTLKMFTLPTPPAGIHFGLLNTQERQEILTFDPKSQRLVTRELIAQFGGHTFNKCFKYYCAHDKSVALHVPPLDPDRHTLETLAKSDVADKGRQIPLPMRLTVLKMNQLRQMSKDLKNTTKFSRKQEATEALAKIPGAAVLLSMQYTVDDLFILNPLQDNPGEIKREWTYLTAYAKLLISRTNSTTTPLNN